MNAHTIALAVAAFLFAAALSAQQSVFPPAAAVRANSSVPDDSSCRIDHLPGATGPRVRVTSLTAGLRRAQGRIVAAAGDTLLFRADERPSACATVSLTSATIDRLEVISGRNHLKGALLGGLAGSVAGALIGIAVTPSYPCNDTSAWSSLDCSLGQLDQAGRAMRAAAVGGGIGLVTGAVLGGVFGHGDTWRDESLTSLVSHLELAPAPGGMALSLHASF